MSRAELKDAVGREAGIPKSKELSWTELNRSEVPFCIRKKTFSLTYSIICIIMSFLTILKVESFVTAPILLIIWLRNDGYNPDSPDGSQKLPTGRRSLKAVNLGYSEAVASSLFVCSLRNRYPFSMSCGFSVHLQGPRHLRFPLITVICAGPASVGLLYCDAPFYHEELRDSEGIYSRIPNRLIIAWQPGYAGQMAGIDSLRDIKGKYTCRLFQSGEAQGMELPTNASGILGTVYIMASRNGKPEVAESPQADPEPGAALCISRSKRISKPGLLPLPKSTTEARRVMRIFPTRPG